MCYYRLVSADIWQKVNTPNKVLKSKLLYNYVKNSSGNCVDILPLLLSVFCIVVCLFLYMVFCRKLQPSFLPMKMSNSGSLSISSFYKCHSSVMACCCPCTWLVVGSGEYTSVHITVAGGSQTSLCVSAPVLLLSHQTAVAEARSIHLCRLDRNHILQFCWKRSCSTWTLNQARSGNSVFHFVTMFFLYLENLGDIYMPIWSDIKAQNTDTPHCNFMQQAMSLHSAYAVYFMTKWSSIYGSAPEICIMCILTCIYLLTRSIIWHIFWPF